MAVETIDLVQDRPWAITREKLDEINAVVLARLNGKAPEARISIPAKPAEEGPGYENRGGVAVIPVRGVLTKRANLFQDWSGGTSYEKLGSAFRAALADKAVGAILLDVDSPGGTVDGLTELAREVRASRGGKPVIAHANGTMASAAYYLAAQADTVLVNESALVGSIGVISMHYDYSESDKQWGVKRTAIAAGRYKAAGGDHQPLDGDGHTYLQGIVDDYYALFVADVAAAREGLTEEAVRATEARVFVGAKAVGQGLADAVATFDEALRKAKEQGRMDKTTLKAQHPELYDAVLEEGRADARADAESAARGLVDAAVASERDRCAKLVAIGGKPEALSRAIADGTAQGDYAMAVLEAERKGREEAVAEARAGLDPAVPPEGRTEEGDFDALVAAHLKENAGCKRSAAIAAVAAKHPALHAKWLSKDKRGKAA